jgi:hypothetical protein
MAQIFPFQPYRYSEKPGDLNQLFTQPYDKISRDLQACYLAASPHNLVRVILGERFPGDDDKENVYTRAAKFLNDRIGGGIVEDAKPAFYADSKTSRSPTVASG